MEIVTLLEAAHLELQGAERRLALATQALADFAMKRGGNACGRGRRTTTL
jgi:hypothetical protein